MKKYIIPILEINKGVYAEAFMVTATGGQGGPNVGNGGNTSEIPVSEGESAWGDAKSRNEFEDFVSSQEGTKTNSLW